MRERTVKIGSAGKIFALTGWKVGFVCAAPALADGARQGAPVPHLHDAAQPAESPSPMASARTMPISTACAGISPRSRDRFAAGARRRAGFAVLPSAGHLFPQHRHRAAGIETDDVAFCRRLVKDHGVAAIPVSAFYAERLGQERGAVLFRETRRHPRRGVGAARGRGEACRLIGPVAHDRCKGNAPGLSDCALRIFLPEKPASFRDPALASARPRLLKIGSRCSAFSSLSSPSAFPSRPPPRRSGW